MTPPPTVDLAETIERQPVNGFVVRLLLISVLATLLDGFDLSAITYAAPYLAPAFGLDKLMLGNVFSVGLFGTMLGAALAGYLGDRFGRRPAIILSTAAFGLFTLAIAGAQGYASLLVLRFLQGVALAGVVPLCWPLNIDYSPRRRAATMVTLVTLGFGIGSSLAGPVSVFLIPRFGWQSLFVFGGLAAMACSVLLWAVLPESLRFQVGRERPNGQIARNLRRFAPGVAIPEGARFIFSDETARPDRLSPRELFRGELRWITPLIWMAYLASSIAVYLFASWGPLIFEEVGFSRSHAAYIASFYALTGAVGGLALMRFTDRYGAIAVASMPALAIPLMLAIGLTPLGAAAFIAMNLSLGAFLTGGHYGVMSLIGPAYPSALRASGAGWASTVAKLGSIVGPLLGGVILTYLPAKTAFALMAACPLGLGLCLLGMVLVRRRGKGTGAAGSGAKARSRIVATVAPP